LNTTSAAAFSRRARQEKALPTAENASRRHRVRPIPGTYVEAVYRPGFLGQVQKYNDAYGASDDAVPVYWYEAPPGFTAGFTTLHLPHQLCPASREVPMVYVAPRV
jgi:hypothetical protein